MQGTFFCDDRDENVMIYATFLLKYKNDLVDSADQHHHPQKGQNPFIERALETLETLF